MTTTADASDVDWPVEGYRDDDGQWHDWDDPVPPEDGDDPDPAYTYRRLAVDLAESHGMSVGEWLGSLVSRQPGALDDGRGDEDNY